MSSPTPILDRIRRRDNERVEKIIELRRTPQWIKRMERDGLPPIDTTNLVNGSWTRPSDGGAA